MKSRSEEGVDAPRGKQRMRRRTASTDCDLWALRLPRRMGFTTHELDVLLFVLLAADLHWLQIGLLPADPPPRRPMSPDFQRSVERKRSRPGTFLGLARAPASAISSRGGSEQSSASSGVREKGSASERCP
jgi:hypothetical protein